MSGWLWLLVPGLIVEILAGVLLLDWRGTLKRHQREIDRTQSRCYACITGASVTSFRSASTASFCDTHRAHFVLLRDLESGG